MTLRPTYAIGSTVYPKVAPESDNAMMVTGYMVRAGGVIIYAVSDADGDEKYRYDYELTTEVKWSDTPATDDEP